MQWVPSVGVSEIITIIIGLVTVVMSYTDLKKRVMFLKEDVDKLRVYLSEINEEINTKMNSLVSKYDNELKSITDRYEKINIKLENDIKDKIQDLKIATEKTHKTIFGKVDHLANVENEVEKKISEFGSKIESIENRIKMLNDLEKNLHDLSSISTKLDMIDELLKEARDDIRFMYKTGVRPNKGSIDDDKRQTNG